MQVVQLLEREVARRELTGMRLHHHARGYGAMRSLLTVSTGETCRDVETSVVLSQISACYLLACRCAIARHVLTVRGFQNMKSQAPVTIRVTS